MANFGQQIHMHEFDYFSYGYKVVVIPSTQQHLKLDFTNRNP